MKKTTFVYVVCGEKKHIETLNVSLQFLKKYSKSEIIVITDLSRNMSEINHDVIIDIKTDEKYNHHEASIFLKTSLHRYLNLKDSIFCYLDTDVLAISDEVDSIFDEKFEIIGCCPDNISLDYFSPYAMNCQCMDDYRKQKELLEQSLAEYSALHQQWEKDNNNSEGKQLEQQLNDIKANKLKNIGSLLSFTIQNINPLTSKIRIGKYTQHKEDKAWYNSKGEKILFPIEKHESYIHRKTGFKYQDNGNYWSFADSKFDVTIPRCTHLHQAIKKEFQIDIKPENWQHANGGVFLFDKNSVDFLETWHQLSLDIFKKTDWKTRDQGTLATTFWHFNLQQNNLLSEKYNYIIDYFCDDIKYDKEFGFTKNNFKTKIQPKMVHIFHHFGDKDWEIWNVINSFKDK